jgi:hypothetical protein
MNPTDDGFRKAVLAESGMPIGVGHWPPPARSEDEQRQFEVALAEANKRFIAFASAEDGMPIGAGWVPRQSTLRSVTHRPLVVVAEEVAQLPRWARVAFAARCAGRVLPLYRYSMPAAEAGHILALKRAVEMAQKAAENGGPPPGEADAQVVDAADHVASDADDDSQTLAAGVAHAAAAAASAYAYAYAPHGDADYAARAADPAELLLPAATVGTAWTLEAPRRDFDRVARLAAEQKWTDDTPVPTTVFGPMWDRDPPPWWIDDVTAGLVLTEGGNGGEEDGPAQRPHP